MNIALIIFRADPQRGGAERYTAQIAALLARRGHQVDLLATRFGEAIERVQFVKIEARGATRAGQYRAFLDALDRHLAQMRYDTVHAMLPVRHCDIYHPHAGMAKAQMGKLSSRLNQKRRAYARVEEKLITEARPLVICLSDYIKGSVLKFYPGIDKQLVKLFNAVDLERFDPAKNQPARTQLRQRLGIAPDAIVALMIAQHFQRKGLAEVIAAAAKLKSQGKQLQVVVLGTDDPSRSKTLAKKLGIENQIHFAGTTDRPEDFYSMADFFVLPTRHDSCSLVVLEALAMGLPVISTIFNGACEIMQDHRQGFVLPDPADVDALTNVMAQVMDEPIRAKMRQASLELRTPLSIQKHLDRLEEIYSLSKAIQKSTAR